MIPTSLPPWAARQGHTPVPQFCPGANRPHDSPANTLWVNPSSPSLGPEPRPGPQESSPGPPTPPVCGPRRGICGFRQQPVGLRTLAQRAPQPRPCGPNGPVGARDSDAEPRSGCDEGGPRSGLGWGVTPGKRGLHQSPLAQEVGPGPVCGSPRHVPSGRKREEGGRPGFLRSHTNAFALGARIKEDFIKSKARAAFAGT